MEGGCRSLGEVVGLITGRGCGCAHQGPNPISQEVAVLCHQILKALNSIHHDKEPKVPQEPGWARPSCGGLAGAEHPSLPREAISLVCEAVPGAKGATRRRKVLEPRGRGRQVWGMRGEGQDPLALTPWSPDTVAALWPPAQLYPGQE